MLEILQISENGLKANQAWLNSISHNVANIQTPGYKKTVVNFGELVSQTPTDGVGETAEKSKGMGVAVHQNFIDARQGEMRLTGRVLDFAIDGNAFFELELSDGSYAYTRVGQFVVNEEGKLATARGDYLAGNVLIPPDIKNIRVESDGRVFADFADSENIELGQVSLVNFANPAELFALGSEKYRQTEKSGEAEAVVDVNANRVLQGYLEMSNVDLIDEMSELLLAQRAYQLNARLIQTADQILETINNLRR